MMAKLDRLQIVSRIGDLLRSALKPGDEAVEASRNLPDSSTSTPDGTGEDYGKVSAELERMLGDRFRRIRLDPRKFEDFRAEYRDPRPGVDAEKMLEYFVSYEYLELAPSDVFMDVAAQDCPFAFFLRDKIGCRVYRQDLYYLEPGVHGEDVGGDATDLPFGDGALSKMALHNSFEHFEGDADFRFIVESQRVLKVGGKLCIVPLFIGPKYSIETEAGWIDENGKKHLWGVGARFSRLYDPAQLDERVMQYGDEFTVEIFEVMNAQEMDPECYLRYFAIMTRQPH